MSDFLDVYGIKTMVKMEDFDHEFYVEEHLAF